MWKDNLCIKQDVFFFHKACAKVILFNIFLVEKK